MPTAQQHEVIETLERQVAVASAEVTLLVTEADQIDVQIAKLSEQRDHAEAAAEDAAETRDAIIAALAAYRLFAGR